MNLLQRLRAAVGPQPEAPTADFTMAGIMPAPGGEEYKGGDHKRDDAGNLFIAQSMFVKTNNNITWVRVIKRSPTGAQVGAWVLAVPANTKTVGNPKLDHNGSNLTVSTDVYGMDAARISDMAYVEIPGVYVVSTAPPPPPTTGDLVITAPTVVAGTYRRV